MNKCCFCEGEFSHKACSKCNYGVTIKILHAFKKDFELVNIGEIYNYCMNISIVIQVFQDQKGWELNLREYTEYMKILKEKNLEYDHDPDFCGDIVFVGHIYSDDFIFWETIIAVEQNIDNQSQKTLLIEQISFLPEIKNIIRELFLTLSVFCEK
jgi:hypothetical protein